MQQSNDAFLETLTGKDRWLAEAFSNLPEGIYIDQSLQGRLTSLCTPSGSRPQEFIWHQFKNVTVMNDQGDWTIFGDAYMMNYSGHSPIVVDLLQSQNIFQIRIGSFYPWKCSLDDTNAIDYRINNNTLVVRCVKLPSTHAAYCNMTGMIAAASTKLILPCE